MDISGSLEKPDIKILGNTLMSQIHLHEQYGGVYPNLAKREHEKNLPPLLQQTLKEAGYILTDDQQLTNNNIDVIAVTNGPGLEPALWVGINFALELGKKWDKPVIPVNHMEGHIFSVFAKRKRFSISNFQFPMLALLVSGGHTQLILSKKWTQYKIIGETLDDAVGEAFDKVARMLGLPYPGGPEISKLSEAQRTRGKQFLRGVSQAGEPRGSAARARTDSDPEKIGFPVVLPRPMLYSKNFDFSFSGLKTAVLYLIRDIEKSRKLDSETKSEIALEFENAAIECLIYKTKKAIEKYKIKTIIVGGGVSGNEHLRREIEKFKKVELLIPEKKFTGDNSLMIGIAGYIQYLKRKRKFTKASNIKATGNLSL